MGNPETGSEAFAREELKTKIQELEQKITLLDSQGNTGPEFAELTKQHEELSAELAEIDSRHDLQAAA